MRFHQATISLVLLYASHSITALPQTSQTPQNQWITLSPIPTPRQEHSAVAINDTTLAILGGIAFVGNTTERSTTDLFQLYDIPTDTWRTAAPAPYKVNHPNVVAVNGKVYLLGGLIDSNDPPGLLVNWVASGESHVYDPATDTWTQVQSMPPGTERGSAILGVHGEMVYVAGGMTVLRADVGQDAVSTVTAFNVSSARWQRVPSFAANLPEGRQHGVGAVVGDVFYVVGGRWFEKSNVRDTVFMLDLKDQDAGWRTSRSRMPTARGGLAGAVVDGRLYTFGGESNPDATNGIFNETEVFSFGDEVWEELEPMAVPRHGTSAVAVGNRIYVPGGGLQEDGLVVVVDGEEHIQNTTAHFDVYYV